MRRLTASVLASLVAVSLAVAAPAQAGSAKLKDKRGDSAAVTDIVRYKVINGKRLGVRVWLRDATKKTYDMQWWMRPAGTTHELHAYATFDGKTKMLLLPGQSYVGQKLSCRGMKVKRKVNKDWAQLTIPRSCVGAGTHDALEAQVRVQRSGSGAKGDSAPSRTGFTRPVPFS